MSPPTLLLGCSTVGAAPFTAEASHALFTTLSSTITRFDTAALYPLAAPGASESILGTYAPASEPVLVDTKILIGPSGLSGSLSKANITASVNASRARIPRGINVLYCHAPDPETPISETAETLHTLWLDGAFQELGVSNFPPAALAEFLDYCTAHALHKPAVYQGRYNALDRSAEKLFPLLRKHGIAFVAYSPLAGGFLTGRFSTGDPESEKGTRFDPAFAHAAEWRATYCRDEVHDAVRLLLHGCAEYKVDVKEASLRWLRFHSALKGEHSDGIILGGRDPDQVIANAQAAQGGALPEALVAVFERAWRVIQGEVAGQR